MKLTCHIAQINEIIGVNSGSERRIARAVGKMAVLGCASSGVEEPREELFLTKIVLIIGKAKLRANK